MKKLRVARTHGGEGSRNSQSNPLKSTQVNPTWGNLAPWLNGYNTALSRRVVRVRIPLEPPRVSFPTSGISEKLKGEQNR